MNKQQRYYQHHKEQLQKQMRDYYHAHKEQCLAYQKQYRDSHKDYWKARYLTWYLLNREQVIKNKVKYKKLHPEWNRMQAIKSDQKIRLDILNYYSNNKLVCACCGEAIYEFLTIDHINGGGNKHRKEIGSSRKLYRWLKIHGYPEGFRVLCMNCNFATRYRKPCPHTKKY